MKNRILIALLMLTTAQAFAQQPQVEMADTFRAEGKIYVVVAIILVILAGFFTYLFLLERKIKKIEKQLDLKDKNA